MFRIWGKIFKKNRLIKDTVIEISDHSMSRTKKVFSCVDQICYEFDLQSPIWLDSTKKDFILYDKTRFYQDSFIENIDFDYLEIQVIEEDYE